ncbi:M20 family metallopeptidase [Sulfuriroseicoccus oceanibius]|uniref:M20 family metallopeptidase n=1 Tax=Sulfuriroseicoccus oceanibius TaxID=2707525 RepID=A0A6B3LCZ7_9BACT|nr:M20 family metallopeptidase [Sulfuriroseicoccus oceanibius]QQL44919.1 M20 family metallopeptidase [Sulfuriroseicoccus oceanibius]
MATAFPQSVVELLQELVRIPSVNPDSATEAEHEFCGEQKVARRVAELLRDLGADVHFDEVVDGRPNVIGTIPFNGAGEPKVRLLLAPHLDTVGISGMSIDPFGGEIRDGKVWGRGASDTKGTAAAMLWCLHQMRDELATLPIEVTFVGLMGEETGQPGSIDFAQGYGDRYDFAIVGEPTECDFVHAHKGCAWIEVAARGQAAHASTPERGHNAIVDLARFVVGASGEFFDRLKRDYAHDVLGVPSLNIGEISGGTRPNIVADRARVMVDIRTTPNLADADPTNLVREYLDELGLKDCTLYEVANCKPMWTPEDNPVLQALTKGTRGKLVTAPWFCDGAHLGNGGIPSVAAGPGSIAQAHTKDEWIEIAALEEGVEFYRECLLAVANA